MGVPRVPNGQFRAPHIKGGGLKNENGSYGNFERVLLVVTLLESS